jgi:hypothetical protein
MIKSIILFTIFILNVIQSQCDDQVTTPTVMEDQNRPNGTIRCPRFGCHNNGTCLTEGEQLCKCPDRYFGNKKININNFYSMIYFEIKRSFM